MMQIVQRDQLDVMSNGARAVRHLRVETASLLAAEDAAFAAKFRALKVASKQSRHVSALTHHQTQWRKEHCAMTKQRKQIEQEVTAHIAVITGDKKTSDGDAALVQQLTAAMRDIDAERVSMQQATQALARELSAAVRRARALLHAARQQKATEKIIVPTVMKQPNGGTKKKAVGFAVEMSDAEARAEAAKVATNASLASSPLTTFLSSFTNRLSIDSSQLAAEEHNLVAQLVLMQETLERYEQSVETEEEEVAVSESPLVELAEHEEMEEHEKSPSDANDAPTSDRSPSHRQSTFLTADALSPRTKRTSRSMAALLSSSSFPPMPEMDPALIPLPVNEQDRARMLREEVWNESFDRMREQIDAKFEANLATLRDTFQSDVAPLRAAVDASDRESHWTPNHTKRFLALLASYKTHGAKRAQLLDRLRLEFSAESTALQGLSGLLGRDILCLATRVDLATASRAYKVQRAALQTAWESERSTFISRAREELLAFDRSFVKEYVHAQSLSEAASAQDARHASLSVLREVKQERDAIRAAEMEAQRRQAEAEIAERLARETEVRQKQRVLLQLYHEHIAAEEAEARAAAARDQARAHEEARHALEENKPRVERRQELLLARRHAQAQREEEARAAEHARQQRLDAIRQLVAPTVERDAARVMQATAASAAEGDPNNPLFAVHGYDMSTLLKDKRFRLQLALWTAGVSHTPYAKEMVQATKPAMAPRPDMQSTVFPSRPM